MNKSTLFILLFALSASMAWCQYRPYHQEDLKKYKKSVRSFEIRYDNYSFGMRGHYRPQRFQGMQVISMNRPGGTHDDVYFIDKNGHTQYHTVRPTAPLNTHAIKPGRYDSSNPSGYQYESIGHAVLDGAATILSEFLID